MILCINLNPAIDKTVVVPDFALNSIHRPEQVMALPGGKGCNVARALKRLGESPVVAGWVGGYAGQFIEEGLRREGIEFAFVHLDSESRTCLSILDPVNETLTELYERGDLVPPSGIAGFLEWFEREISEFAAVTFSGSLPPGVSPDLYAQLIRIAHAAHVPTLLDTSGDALSLGITASPAWVKPNKLELQGLSGKRLETVDEFELEAVEISRRYKTVVVVSLGPDGAVCARGDHVIRARPPKVSTTSAVGSGDALLAGIALGVVRSLPVQECLRIGVAAGTANSMTMGAGVFSEDDFRRVQSQVTIPSSFGTDSF